jgi:hypothetical protein
LLAPTLAALLCPDSIHSPDICQLFSPDSIHSPDICQPFPRTRYIRSRLTFAIFEKNVTRLDTFARVIRHFGKFGASGHCLNNILKFKVAPEKNYFNFYLKHTNNPTLMTVKLFQLKTIRDFICLKLSILCVRISCRFVLGRLI